MNKRPITALIVTWFTMALLFGLSTYRTSYRETSGGLGWALLSGVIFSTFFIIAMAAAMGAKSRKLNKLFNKYGMTQTFVDKCDKMMKKEKNGVYKTQVAAYLADKYFHIGDCRSAINVLRANAVPGALPPMTEISITNNLLFYSMMDGDMKAAEEMFIILDGQLKMANVTPSRLPSAVADTLAVREYLHGNYEGSVSLLNMIKAKTGSIDQEYRDLHLAWNYNQTGRKDEAKDILQRLSQSAKDEYAKNQAFGLLKEMESGNVTNM